MPAGPSCGTGAVLLHGAARRSGQFFCGTGPPDTPGTPPGAAPRARRAPLGTAPPLAQWDGAAPRSEQPEAAAHLHHSPVCTPGHGFSRHGQTDPQHFCSKPGTSQRIPPKLPASSARASPQPRGASAEPQSVLGVEPRGSHPRGPTPARPPPPHPRGQRAADGAPRCSRGGGGERAGATGTGGDSRGMGERMQGQMREDARTGGGAGRPGRPLPTYRTPSLVFSAASATPCLVFSAAATTPSLALDKPFMNTSMAALRGEAARLHPGLAPARPAHPRALEARPAPHLRPRPAPPRSRSRRTARPGSVAGTRAHGDGRDAARAGPSRAGLRRGGLSAAVPEPRCAALRRDAP